jgi:hypothetical protein
LAFTSKGKEAPEVIEIAAPDVHDYHAAYLDRVNSKLSNLNKRSYELVHFLKAHVQQPRCFLSQTFHPHFFGKTCLAS